MVVPVKTGDVLAGKYRVEEVLGVGGMGVVVAAVHEQLGQRVAIKFLLPEIGKDGMAVSRFMREARAAASIRGEHVVRVSDVGQLDNGSPYMVMEYLTGSDLADTLSKQGPLQPERAVDYVLQACEALAEAHAAGIVHRDLKPANLFLARRPDGSALVKVLDFGISKVTTETESAAMTATGAVMGSPLYMSPEQMKSAKLVDLRSDVWALGVILHELLAGSPPFIADTMPGLCAAILQDEPPRLRTLRPEVHPALEAVISRCMEKDPARRFSSVAELARALGPLGTASSRVSVDRILGIAGTTGAAAPVPDQAPTMGPALAAATAPGWGLSARPRRRRAVVLVGAAVSSIIAVTLASAAWMGSRRVVEPTGNGSVLGAPAVEQAVAPPVAPLPPSSTDVATPEPSTTPPPVVSATPAPASRSRTEPTRTPKPVPASSVGSTPAASAPPPVAKPKTGVLDEQK